MSQPDDELLDHIIEFFNNENSISTEPAYSPMSSTQSYQQLDIQLNPALTALENLITNQNGGEKRKLSQCKSKPNLRKLLYNHILKIIQNLFTIIANKSFHKKNLVQRNKYKVKSIKFNHKIHLYFINSKMKIRFVQKDRIITYEMIRHHNPFKYKKVYKAI
jgi:hypothetical protein